MDACLSSLYWSTCVLSACVLSACVLSACVLSACVLSTCVLSTCVLSACVLSACVLSACVLSTCVLSTCVLSTCFSLVWIAFPRAGGRRQGPTQKSWNSLNNWQKFYCKWTKSHKRLSLYFLLFPVSVTSCSPQLCSFHCLSSIM